ncbi:MAG: sensor histidine kinase [Pyrinomonadaceae bacterium]|nr:sensor histidine kinase [Pyrinomonadaceae bacterium]
MNLRFSKQSLISFIIGYGMAFLSVVAALLLTLMIWSVIKPIASPLFLVAAMLTAWKRGVGAGVFATLISGFVIDYFFIAPQYQLSGNFDDVMRLSVFTLEGFVLCWLITYRAKAAAEIKISREQLLALSLRQQTLREDERKRIALEIHDELGQALTGLKMETYLLKKQIAEAETPEKCRKTDEKIDELLHLIDGTIVSVRRIATELRPAILDDLGVIAAIEWQSREFQRRTGVACEFSANVEDLNLNSEFSTAVFRIYQESLTNITRHAEARSVVVDIKKSDRTLVMRVEDDGKGMGLSDNSDGGSLGIFGMRERARLIGGELAIFSGARGGTTVLLTAPLN